MCIVVCVFFFIKQKTAYEMRISDWSSDVCSSDLVARRDGDQGRIYSDKWFCSNADTPLVMTLARPEDEDGNTVPGLKGLGLFLIPRTLDHGTANAYRIVRLKNKLGTPSIASDERRMEGPLDYADRKNTRQKHC